MPDDVAAFNEEDCKTNNEEEFDQLRANVEALTIVSELRRQIIGGISEDDVKQCINTIQHHYQGAEKTLLDKVEALELNKRRMTRDFEVYRQETEREKNLLEEKLNQAMSDFSDYKSRCEQAELELTVIVDRYTLEINQLETEREMISIQCGELSRQVEELEKHSKVIAEEKLEFENKNRTQKFRIAVLEQEIALSKGELDERSKLCEELQRHNSELAQTLQEQDGKSEKEIRAKRIELANSLEMREMLEARIEELQEQLSLSKKKAEDLYQAYLEMEQKTQLMEKQYTEYSKPVSYKEEIVAIYNQLNSLNEQLIVNENLQRELETERQRAEKAEFDLAELVDCVAELKNRLYADQIQLEGYFMHLEEKQKAVQNDVDDFRSNLKKFCGDTGAEISGLYETVKKRYEVLKKVGT